MNKQEEEFQKGIFGHIHWKRLKWGFYVVAVIMLIMEYWTPAILCLACGVLVNPRIRLPFKQSTRFILLCICTVFFIISAAMMQEDENNGDTYTSETNMDLSYDFDKDVENGLLYSNAQGQIIDEAGNAISEYSDMEVQANGEILIYGEVMQAHHAGAGGKIIKDIPEPVDFGAADDDYTSENTDYDDTEFAANDDFYEENEEINPEPTSAIPENPNTQKSVDETIDNKINSVVDNAADGFMNGLLGVFVGMADSGVDKRNIDMYYGTWYDSDTGKYIYIKEGKDYKIDLSDVGYGKNVSGTFTSSQTIYMGSIGMGIIMNDDGSIYIDTISISGKDPLGGHYVKQ